MSTALFNTLAQAEAATGTNPLLIIGIILGLLLIVVIFLLIQRKSNKALENLDETQKKLPGKAETTGQPALAGPDDKSKLSLAELKESKRTAVSDSHSKDELRELRKERRAATQTANAIHDREEAALDDHSEAAEDSSHEESAAADAENDKMTAPINDILTNSDAGASDVFASLFGTNKSNDNSLKIDDIIEETEKPADDAVFPMLGSKLIPLDQLMAAAAGEEINPDTANMLEGLSKTIPDMAEKKTLT